MSNFTTFDGQQARPMSEEEKIAYEAACATSNEAIQNAASMIEARKVPLRRLGLTEDEINTVLGL